MRMKMLLAFHIVAWISNCAPSKADEIYNNGDFPLSQLCLTFVNETTSVQAQAVDDFILPDGNLWVIDGANWVGALIEFELIQPSVGLVFNFNLLVFEDIGGMPPGSPVDPIPGTAIAHRQVTVEGAELCDGCLGAFYEAFFDPILLDGGITYWFAIVPSGDFTFDLDNTDGTAWVWGGGSVEEGNAHGGATFGSGEWSLQAGGGIAKDFSLFGTAIPEPSSTALLGVSLIAPWMRRRR